MNRYRWLLGALVGCVGAVAIIWLLAPRHAYVSNQQLFAGFHGKKELEAKLLSLKERHTHILDSMRVDVLSADGANGVTDGQQERKLRFLEQIGQEFAQEEQEKSSEYTQQIWNQINGYIREYGEREGYDFIYGIQGSGNMMYAREDRDITDDVLRFINQKYEGN